MAKAVPNLARGGQANDLRENEFSESRTKKTNKSLISLLLLSILWIRCGGGGRRRFREGIFRGSNCGGEKGRWARIRAIKKFPVILANEE